MTQLRLFPLCVPLGCLFSSSFISLYIFSSFIDINLTKDAFLSCLSSQYERLNDPASAWGQCIRRIFAILLPTASQLPAPSTTKSPAAESSSEYGCSHDVHHHCGKQSAKWKSLSASEMCLSRRRTSRQDESHCQLHHQWLPGRVRAHRL